MAHGDGHERAHARHGARDSHAPHRRRGTRLHGRGERRLREGGSGSGRARTADRHVPEGAWAFWQSGIQRKNYIFPNFATGIAESVLVDDLSVTHAKRGLYSQIDRDIARKTQRNAELEIEIAMKSQALEEAVRSKEDAERLKLENRDLLERLAAATAAAGEKPGSEKAPSKSAQR